MNPEPQQIGGICNTYGSLYVRSDGKTYEWGIDDWSGTGWEPIPKYLYDALIKYESERDKS